MHTLFILVALICLRLQIALPLATSYDYVLHRDREFADSENLVQRHHVRHRLSHLRSADNIRHQQRTQMEKSESATEFFKQATNGVAEDVTDSSNVEHHLHHQHQYQVHPESNHLLLGHHNSHYQQKQQQRRDEHHNTIHTPHAHVYHLHHRNVPKSTTITMAATTIDSETSKSTIGLAKPTSHPTANVTHTIILDEVNKSIPNYDQPPIMQQHHRQHRQQLQQDHHKLQLKSDLSETKLTTASVNGFQHNLPAISPQHIDHNELVHTTSSGSLQSGNHMHEGINNNVTASVLEQSTSVGGSTQKIVVTTSESTIGGFSEAQSDNDVATEYVDDEVEYYDDTMDNDESNMESRDYQHALAAVDVSYDYDSGNDDDEADWPLYTAKNPKNDHLQHTRHSQERTQPHRRQESHRQKQHDLEEQPYYRNEYSRVARDHHRVQSQHLGHNHLVYDSRSEDEYPDDEPYKDSSEQYPNRPGELTFQKYRELGTMQAVQQSRDLYLQRQKSPSDLATEHINRMKVAARCSRPLPRVFHVSNDTSKTYVPSCTILHRCGEDTGCCRSMGQVCTAKTYEDVPLYFIRPNRLTPSQIEHFIDNDEDFDECSEDGDEDYMVEQFELEESSDEYLNSDNDEDIVPALENESSVPMYYCKDRAIEWSTEPVGHNSGRARIENIMHGRQGVTAYAVHRISTIKESFDQCFTYQLKQIIIQFSNIEGEKKIGAGYKKIDEIELDAYLGILILAGVYRSHEESIRSLWDEVHGRPLFRATMSLGRFLEINRVLRFDDRDNRRAQRMNDKLAPIRYLYEKWVANLPLLFVPYENITVDERLIPFRGRCPFLVYMPSKPSKYGMKAWVAADVRTKFCLNFQIYLGKESASAPPERNQGQRVVLDLVSGYEGRNITTDNFFTTRDLALELLKKIITLVGTVRSNKRFLPVCGTKVELRSLPVLSSRHFFNGSVTLVQYIPKKYKMVTVLSTLHHDKSVMENHPKKLPDIINFYNSTKSGVDAIDQLVETYTCKRQTNRWPVAIFANIVDISALNAYVLWTEINPSWNAAKTYKRRLFLESFGLDLVHGEIERRKTLPRTQPSADIVRNMRADAEQPSTSAGTVPKKRKPSERATFAVCPSSIRRKTYESCTVCKKPVCPQHRSTVTVSKTYCLEHSN